MLVLTRRQGESIHIGQDITVTVLGVQGNQVRIGIDAPREVAIARDNAKNLEPPAPRVNGVRHA